jgi:hypothetical protein
MLPVLALAAPMDDCRDMSAAISTRAQALATMLAAAVLVLALALSPSADAHAHKAACTHSAAGHSGQGAHPCVGAGSAGRSHGKHGKLHPHSKHHAKHPGRRHASAEAGEGAEAAGESGEAGNGPESSADAPEARCEAGGSEGESEEAQTCES